MKRILLIFISVFCIFVGILAQPNWNPDDGREEQQVDPDDGREEPVRPKYWLPENFFVYVRGNAVINHPAPGYQKKAFPTRNLFKSSPGCYVACYTHNKDNAVYGVGGNIYVAGQLRLRGDYIGRVCHPAGYRNKDISAAQKFKFLCSRYLQESCRGGCWAGGDTGGWFGIQ